MLRKLIIMAIAALAAPAAAFAQSDWPTEPIHAIVPFPSGGQADIVTRIIAEPVAEILGQPIIVETKPGAGGNVGTEFVADSAADGNTWLHTGVPLTTAPAPVASITTSKRFGRFGTASRLMRNTGR